MKRLSQQLTPNDWQPLLLVVGFLGFVDLTMVPLATTVNDYEANFVFVLVALGLVLTQGVLLDLAVVFGSGPFWQRLILGSAYGGCVLACWLLGLSQVYDQRHFNLRDLTQVIALITFLALAGQIPLWFTRIVCGWRFISTGTTASRTERQFSLADLSAATAFIGITIGLVRPAMVEVPAQSNWLALGVIAISVITFATFFVLPILALFFSNLARPIAWTAAIGYSALVSIFALPVAAFVGGVPVSLPIVVMLMVTLTSCTTGIGAACSLMRSYGIRWDQPRQPSPDS